MASVDLPNRGGLPPWDSMDDDAQHDFLTLSVDRIAATLALAIVTTPEINGFVAIGHSLGALMAGVLAARSDGVRGLVLLAPSPPGNMPHAQGLPPITDVKTPFKFTDYDLTVQKFWPDIDDEKTLKTLFATLNGESPTIINERYELTVSVPWPPHKCPALVIEAEWDNPKTHPPHQDKRVAEFYQGDYIFMPKTGHCLMVSPHWQDGANHIYNWLQSHKLSPS